MDLYSLQQQQQQYNNFTERHQRTINTMTDTENVLTIVPAYLFFIRIY